MRARHASTKKMSAAVNKALAPHIREQGIHKIITEYAYATFQSVISRHLPTQSSLPIMTYYTKDSTVKLPTNIKQLLFTMLACQLSYLDYIDASDSAGQTPLHWTSLHNLNEAANVLIENHALINPLSNTNDTPLDWAIYTDNFQVAKLLKENGGIENNRITAFIQKHFSSKANAGLTFWYNRPPNSITLDELLYHAKEAHNTGNKTHTGYKIKAILEKNLNIKITDLTTVEDLQEAIINKTTDTSEHKSCVIL